MSALAGPEMIATLVRRARSDRQLAQQLPRLRFLFRLDWAASYSVVDVDTPVIAESMRLAERHGLRGADAVHLAAAVLQERRRRADGAPPMTFISADQEQLAAATLEGLL